MAIASIGIDRAPAWRMATLAFVAQAITIGCIFGPFAVLLVAVEARTGANRELTALALPLLSVAAALSSPLVGHLAARISLRLLMVAGAAAGIAGFVLLAVSDSIAAYLLAYALLIGPGMCLCASVLPTVLVSRWFQRERGRALGFIHMPVMTMIVPVPAAYLLGDAGLPAVYWTLAALMAVVLLASLLIVDHPAGGASPADDKAAASVENEWTLRRVTAQPWYWGLVFALATVTTAGMTVAIHIVAMARQWGIEMAPAASLLSFSAFAGLAGSFVFGWLAEKLGGRLTIVIVCVDVALLWAVLLLHPPFALLTPVVGLLGLHVAGVVPAFALATSRLFGPAGFGAAFGLALTIAMMLPLLIAPISSALYVGSGSYAAMIVLHVGLLLAGALAALLSVTRRG